MYTLAGLLHFLAVVLIVAVTVPAILYVIVPRAQRPRYSRKGH